jgi:hypothetical protein
MARIYICLYLLPLPVFLIVIPEGDLLLSLLLFLALAEARMRFPPPEIR